MKNPASQFYWSDWLTDPGIQQCSFAARGLWMQMLCIMWHCPRRGYFSNNGSNPSPQEASRMCGIPVEMYVELVEELTRCHVLSRDSNGVIYNRRMVREEQLKQGNRERQRKHREKMSQDSHNVSSYLLLNNNKIKDVEFSVTDQKKEEKKDKGPNPPYYKNDRGNYVCKYKSCGKEFMTYENLKQHFRSNHLKTTQPGFNG